MNGDATMANRGPPWPNCSGGILVHPGGAPVCAGIACCCPGYSQFAPDHPGLLHSSPGTITVCHNVTSVLPVLFYIASGSPRFTPVILNI